MAKRPGGLTAICVMAIVLGVMGLFAGAIQATVLAVGQDQIQKMSKSFTPPGQNPRVTQLQDDMNREMMKVANRWKGFHIILTVGMLGLSFGLLVGGGMSLGLKPLGRTLLLGTCVLAIPFEIIRAVPTVSMAMDNAKITEKYMGQIIEASAPPGKAMPKGVKEGGEIFTKILMFFSMAFAGGWILLKLCYFVIAAFSLASKQSEALFAGMQVGPDGEILSPLPPDFPQ